MTRPRGPIKLALGMLAASTLIATTVTVATAETSRAATAAQSVADAMQPGWNLGNSFDAVGTDETAWGNPVVSQALLTNIKAQGFNSIRIPATWGQHEGAAPSYTIDATFLARVQTVVDQAIAANLYVVLDVHHDSWQWVTNMPSQHDTVLAQFNATWTQLAAAFKTRSSKLILEPINEQSFTGSSGDAQSYQLMDELNRSFYSIVRGSGGTNATRPLLLPTLYTNGDQARLDALASTVTALNDPNILTTIHYYGYWPFSTNIAGTTTFDATTQQDLTDAFDRAYNTFIAKGIPVVIGEYGLLGFDKNTGTIEQGEKLKYFEFFGYYAKYRNITTMLWDNGQHFDRTSFVWKDPDLFAQIKSSWTGRSGTASTDQIFVAKSESIFAKTITLNLNGTTFTGLSQGSTKLTQGSDYTVSGDQLTLPASTVTKLVGSRAYGTNATLTATFSAGVPWKINVISYDTPVLSSATGTSTSLVIPTQFNGDKLATMEATNADGSGAGPQNWTTYKEFDYAFSPNPAANTITIPENFFKEANDGTITLKFHFWSGAVITYTLVKSGTSVTGTASGGGTTTTTTTTTTTSTTTTTTTTTRPTTTTTTTTTRPTSTTTTRPTTTTTRRTTTTTRPTTTTSRATTTTTTGGGTGGCTATLTVASQWPGGFVADVKVTAGSALSGWKVTLTLPSGTSIQNTWNGVQTGNSGTVTVANAGYNGAVPAGGSTSFGFQGTGTITGTTATCAAA